MPNRLFFGIINQMKEVIDRTIGVIDENYAVIACSDLGAIGEVREELSEVSFSTQDAFTMGGYTYRAFGPRPHGAYLVFVEGEDEQAKKDATLLGISFDNIKQYYD